MTPIQRAWLHDIRAQAVLCEARRPLTRKPTRTGTISEAACLYLRGLVERVQPKVCIEIGTFIGTSALVLLSTGAFVATCDIDNGCVQSEGRLVAYPKTSSTAMFADLQARGVKADLFFFDGRIQEADVPLILALSSKRAVYAFDDYTGREKGVINVARLLPALPNGYRLTPPPARVLDLHTTTTIAVLERAA
jgi:hypothetical protein